MTTNKDHAVKIMNAQYTKTAVENVLTDLKELYETSLEVKAAMSANAVLHYAGPLSAPFDSESPSTATVEPKSLITIGGLAKLHKAINSLHLVVDQQNKIINPDQEPVSPVDEVRRQVAEAAKGNAPGSVTQTTTRYNLLTPAVMATHPERALGITEEAFERDLKVMRESYRNEEKEKELPVTSSEPSGALPKVIPIHDGPAPPKNNLELLASTESPLCGIFAPSPWFHEGRGIITVGSTDFGYYKDVNPATKDDVTRTQLPNGFYGNDGNERPTHVLLRMKASILLWDFNLDPECMVVFIVGLSDDKPKENPRWFKASALGASWTSRIVNDLSAYLRELNR